MLDFNTVTEFSHTYCIAICAFLVPANLLATLMTGILTGLNRPRVQVRASVVVASLFATTMIFHVFTWFAIGVVMPPTYILLLMAIVCYQSLGDRSSCKHEAINSSCDWSVVRI
jgi:hypothetical protein